VCAADLRPGIKMSDLATHALEYAKTQIGVHEEPPGSNAGPQVDAYLADVGLGPGESWCLSFVHYSFDQAAKALKVPNPLLKTGSCSALYEWAAANGKLVSDSGDVQPGDIGLVIGGPTGHRHAVFVLRGIDGTNRCETIEGNSNTQGSADGEAVVHLDASTPHAGRDLDSMDYVRV